MIFCIDIGNTHTHYGVVAGTHAIFQRNVPTQMLDHPVDGLGPIVLNALAEHPKITRLALCSVVPSATAALLKLIGSIGLPLPLFQLSHEKQLGVAVTYPKPEEIGPDRLANAAGAQALFGAPAIVIDMGTAVTFDIISKEKGYEGGIIAPGLELMRRYLHEQTALLPLLDDSLSTSGAIGKSTTEAMRIGTVVGFGGMINALLDEVLNELAPRGEWLPRIIATGGSSEILRRRLRHTITYKPDLTLVGLATACRLNATHDERKN